MTLPPLFMKLHRLSGMLALALLFASQAALGSDISHSNWSETAASNNAASPNGWPTGMTPSQVEPSAREGMAAVKRFYNHINAVKTSAGTANVQTLTYDVAPAAYVTGDAYAFKVGAGLTNTGSTTLNINSLGAKTLRVGAAALSAGELVAGRIVVVYYDGTDFQLVAGGKTTGALLPVMACGDLTDDGSACPANVGTSGDNLGKLNANKTDSGTNIFSGVNTLSGNNTHSGDNTFSGDNDFTGGTQTFGPVYGTARTVAGTSDTLSATDCGKTIVYTSGSAVTVTTFASAVSGTKTCSIAIHQQGAGAVTIADGSGATSVSAHGCVKTYAQYATMGLFVEPNNPSQWKLLGDCSP